jgi:dolichyl-phosphate beta-glucosyltransferase
MPMVQDGAELFLSVIIPAFNEEGQIEQTLASVCSFLQRRSFDWETVVVDDGSTDQTARLVTNFSKIDPRVRLLQYGVNHGKGYAVRYGMLQTSGKYRLFMDADNSTAIDHFELFLPLLESGTDIVIGSRAVVGAEIAVHQPKWKEILGMLGNRWIRILTVPGIQDTQAGFKVFSAEAAQNIFPYLTIDGWGFDIELLVIARSRGYKIAEVPIRWINNPQTKVTGMAYFEVLKDVIKVRYNIWRGIY